MTLNDRIKKLEQTISEMQYRILELSGLTQGKTPPPRTSFGFMGDKSNIHPMDVQSGQGGMGGAIFWHDKEIYAPYGTEPDQPTEGYNKHTHSRFSGGALIKGAVEIVEFKPESLTNLHSQQFKKLTIDDIEDDVNSQKQPVKKIGLLDLFFNPDGGYDEEGNPKGTWGVSAYAIDVEKCYFVKRRKTAEVDEEGNPIPGKNVGDIELDENGHEMKSPLYITKPDGTQDIASSSIIWDKNGNKGNGCFRLFTVYAPGD